MKNLLHEILNFFFGAVCHQETGWLLETGDDFLPICTRCAGIYVGIFGIRLFFLAYQHASLLSFPKLRTNLVSGLLALSMLIEWICVRSEMFSADPARRYYTGVAFGLVLGMYFLLYYNRVKRTTLTSRSPLSIWEFITALTFTLALAFLLYRINSTEIYATVLTITFVLFWVEVNYFLLIRFVDYFRKTNRILPLALAFLLFSAELYSSRYIWHLL